MHSSCVEVVKENKKRVPKKCKTPDTQSKYFTSKEEDPTGLLSNTSQNNLLKWESSACSIVERVQKGTEIQ